MITENIKVLMEDTGCEETEARLALELANDNLEQAIINIGVMLKYITAYKAKIKLKNENIFGLIHIITNNKNLDLLRFSSVMTYNPVIYEQSATMDWFSFEKAIYSYRLAVGVTEKDTKTIETNFRDFISSNLKQHKILTVNDLENVFEEFFVDNDIQVEIVAEELTLRDFKKLPNYLPDSHLGTSAFQDMVAIELEVVILEDNAGKKVENIVEGDMVLVTIIDTRDISHYLGHLIGAIKDNEMIPFAAPVHNIKEQDNYYDVYVEYANLIT
ncbi:MAG: hypothetical protein WCQ83_01750, partial [Endomicrobiia bacterium]